MRKYLLFFLLFLFFSSVAFASISEVKYAGFAFCGEFKDIPSNFKYSFNLAKSTEDEVGRNIFDKKLFDFFQENKALIKDFALILRGDTNTKVSMALALAQENISVVSLDDVYKIVVNLGCNLIFIDFNNMQILSSYPLYLEYIDAKKKLPTKEYKMNLVKELYFSKKFSILKILKKKLEDLKLNNDANLSFRIMDVHFKKAVKEKIGIYKNNIDAFKSIIAQRFSDFLSSKLNISILPYAKDYLGARMSLVFSNAKVQNFRIPSTSYGIDFTLCNLTKELYKKGVGEDAYLYGVYSTTKVYDPDLGTKYWKERVKYGTVKNIPKLQKTFDDFSIYNEMIDSVILQTVKKMKNDTRFYKEVIRRCLNR